MIIVVFCFVLKIQNMKHKFKGGMGSGLSMDDRYQFIIQCFHEIRRQHFPIATSFITSLEIKIRSLDQKRDKY